MKRKVLFITNIPNPYRISFFNKLADYFDLTVLFEAKGAEDQGIKFNWNEEMISKFQAVFLSEGSIKERRFDFRIIEKLNLPYDEIIVTNYAYMTEMLAILYLKFKRISYSMEIDGGIIKKESVFRRSLKHFLISGAKRYFSSSLENDEFLMYYGAKSERIIRYPFTSVEADNVYSHVIPLSKKNELKKKMQINENKIILGVGQFIHRKGWDVLLKSCIRLRDETVGVYIIGGEVTEEYLTLIENNKLTNIHFLDFMSSDLLKNYYTIADVFVLPTREDIWGLVVNEALSYGLPVITTTACIAGLEMIKEGENGFLVNVEDEKDLAEKIEFVLADEFRRIKMAQNSLVTARKYTIEEMVKVHVKELM